MNHSEKNNRIRRLISKSDQVLSGTSHAKLTVGSEFRVMAGHFEPIESGRG